MKELETLLKNRWILKSRDKEMYYRLRDSLGSLRKFATEKLGCQIIENSILIKMEKIPVVPEGFMGIRDLSSKEEYAYLCMLLMFLEDKDAQEQFILSQLTEYLAANMPGELSDWTLYTNRRKLIRVLRYAVKEDIIGLTDGRDDSFMDDKSGEVLYENTGSSRYFMRNFSRDIMEYTNPERLDPFGSRDRKMSSYLLEDDDGLDERTGYLYIEFKRQDNETYLTIGMGIRARRGKNLDKWYFALTDGRRIGKDFFLYKDMGEKVTLSKKELANRIGDGGRVIERQADYMEYVNKQLFGFETADEYKELLDLLIQLRTPKLSKDFKPSVINDILSDSLQALSDEDLRPMSEAIENMDTMNMNLKSRKEAKQAAEKISDCTKIIAIL